LNSLRGKRFILSIGKKGECSSILKRELRPSCGQVEEERGKGKKKRLPSTEKRIGGEGRSLPFCLSTNRREAGEVSFLEKERKRKRRKGRKKRLIPLSSSQEGVRG